MPKQLKEEDIKELRAWLTANNMPIKQIHRDFSDGVQAASLLKKFYPKLIDLHNYPARNSVQLKLDNWETLNMKVLTKLGLAQSKMQLERYARGTVGSVEILLNDIMQLERARSTRDGRGREDSEGTWCDSDDVIIVTVNKKIGDAIVQVPQKMILFSTYEQIVRESSAKDAYLHAAQQKIAHLENIIRLKAERIDELCAQLARVSARNLLKEQGLESATNDALLQLDTIGNIKQERSNEI